MKNRIFQVLAACVALFFLNSCDSAIPFESLPQNARDFITSNFPGVTVPYLESTFPGIPAEKLERTIFGSYKIELVNDAELKFNSKGVLKSCSF